MKVSLDIYSSQLEEVVTTMLAGLIAVAVAVAVAVADARGQTVAWCRERARDRLRDVDRIAINGDVRRTLFFTTELACHLARMMPRSREPALAPGGLLGVADGTPTLISLEKSGERASRRGHSPIWEAVLSSSRGTVMDIQAGSH